MTTSRPIKVSIVEDDEDIRASLAILINGVEGFRCVGSYESAEAALAGIPRQPSDVVLMDIQLPRASGIECSRQLKQQMPSLQIVMLTVFEDDVKLFKALAAGASGYLLKRTPPNKILEAIQEVHLGGSPMSSFIARKVIKSFQKSAAEPAGDLPELSEREREILSWLVKGYRYKEIADELSISIDTVRSHLRRIYERLHVHSRTEAVVKFLGK